MMIIIVRRLADLHLASASRVPHSLMPGYLPARLSSFSLHCPTLSCWCFAPVRCLTLSAGAVHGRPRRLSHHPQQRVSRRGAILWPAPVAASADGGGAGGVLFRRCRHQGTPHGQVQRVCAGTDGHGDHMMTYIQTERIGVAVPQVQSDFAVDEEESRGLCATSTDRQFSRHANLKPVNCFTSRRLGFELQ